MKRHATTMGMNAILEVCDPTAHREDIDAVLEYFNAIDARFSTYIPMSEVEKMNAKKVSKDNYSNLMQEILALCEKTKKETDGYFDCYYNAKFDPSGLIKGYAIWKGAQMLKEKKYQNIFCEIAGDIQVYGKNKKGTYWSIGITNPFAIDQIIEVVNVTDCGIATSGNYQRGYHIYNPHTHSYADEIASVSVIGPNVFDADRFATAAFAMGMKGLSFIESSPGFEAYVVTKDKRSYMTSGFTQYVKAH